METQPTTPSVSVWHSRPARRPRMCCGQCTTGLRIGRSSPTAHCCRATAPTPGRRRHPDAGRRARATSRWSSPWPASCSLAEAIARQAREGVGRLGVLAALGMTRPGMTSAAAYRARRDRRGRGRGGPRGRGRNLAARSDRHRPSGGSRSRPVRRWRGSGGRAPAHRRRRVRLRSRARRQGSSAVGRRVRSSTGSSSFDLRSPSDGRRRTGDDDLAARRRPGLACPRSSGSLWRAPPASPRGRWCRATTTSLPTPRGTGRRGTPRSATWATRDARSHDSRHVGLDPRDPRRRDPQLPGNRRRPGGHLDSPVSPSSATSPSARSPTAALPVGVSEVALGRQTMSLLDTHVGGTVDLANPDDDVATVLVRRRRRGRRQRRAGERDPATERW